MKFFLYLLFVSTTVFPIEHPVNFELRKIKPGEYGLTVSVPKQFGIQRDAPNRILLSAESGLDIAKADLTFHGGIHPDKKEYFNRVDEMKVNLKGKGKLLINAKIFYCDFTKNICIPANIQKSEIIQ